MEISQQTHRDTVTKQQFVDAMTTYLGTFPFDAERFAIIAEDIIQDEDMDLYIDDILYDYEQGEAVDEVEVWSYVFDNNKTVFQEIFSAYYSNGYLRELIELSEEKCHISSQIAEILDEKTQIGKDIKNRYVQQIQRAFDTYPSSRARQSLIQGAQKVLVDELLQTSPQI